MDKVGLQSWLIDTKGFQKKSARDIVSRCKRVEKIFSISLDVTLQSKADIDGLIDRLGTESSSYLAPEVKKVYAVSVLRRAVKLYAEYRQIL